MTRSSLRQRRPIRLALIVSVAAASTSLTIAAAGTAGATARPPEPAAPSIPTPMSTSIDTTDGMWATLPMGRLDESLNTFWQLFNRPSPTAPWSNHVEATATATNGGLVLAAGATESLIVGIRPSSYLTFTPMVSTSGDPTSWSNGLIEAGLAARPDALAVGAGGRALALVGRGDHTTVLRSGGNLSTWSALTTEKVLGSDPAGRACDLGALTAVGYLGGKALLAGSCARPGVAGLFVRRGGAWQLAGPTLSQAIAGGRVEVLSVQTTSATTTALLAVSRGSETDLVAAWSVAGQWSTSTPLRLPAGTSLSSIGPAGAGAVFVLTQGSSGQSALAIAQPSSAVWQKLPQPPSGTATVVFSPSSPVEALVGSATVLTVWSLDSGASRWVSGQVLHVPIQYGSSTQ